MKFLDYIYYKLYQAILKSSIRDIPEFMTPVFLGGLLGVNVFVFSAFLANMGILPFIFSNKVEAVGLFLLFIVLMFLVYKTQKRNQVLEKYSRENNSRRIMGNTFMFIYVFASFLMIFLVAFLKPA